jgi:hypothetical protein
MVLNRFVNGGLEKVFGFILLFLFCQVCILNGPSEAG